MTFSLLSRPLRLLASGLLLLLLLAACAGNHEYRGFILDRAEPLPNFELVADDGQPFQLETLEGDILVVYFGFTYCPDVCPLTLAKVTAMLEEMEADNVDSLERVKVLLVSVDPERDTPEVLDRYLGSFDPDFIGLTGDMRDIEGVMKPFAAFAEKETVENSSVGYLVNHTSRTYVVAPDRTLILQYPFGFEADDLRADLTYLLNNLEE